MSKAPLAFAALAALVTACGGGPLPRTHVDPPDPVCPIPVGEDDPAYGDVDALVTVVFFGNPTQPETYRALDEVLAITVREGNARVRAVYKFLPQANDTEGAHLADASLSVRDLAGTTAFFQYQRLLLSGFVGGTPRPFSSDKLSQWAKQTGVQNDDAFRATAARAKTREDLEANATLARRLGVTETPTLFVNGQRTPFLPEGIVTETIERELKKSESRLSTGLPRQKLYATSCHENGGRGINEVRAVQSTLSSGLVIKDTEVGTGREALAGDKVVVHYTGSLQADGSVFDSSVGRGPFEFQLGKRMVIAGWERGVIGMRVGGKRQLVVPPELGYGARGQPPRIPPKATLVFDIELLEVKPGDPPPPKEPAAPKDPKK